jgi:type II secretory pathway component PulF
MNHDEFSFFNRQLAAMLHDGIPLEGALHRLCEEMRRGELRSELQRLESDLAEGIPLNEALTSRKLPGLYKQMVRIGVAGGNLPGALTMLADYYHRQNNLAMRLKGVMVYPLIVLFVAFLISIFCTVIWHKIVRPALFSSWFGSQTPNAALPILQHFWIFPLALGLLFLIGLALIFIPRLREKIRWRLPAFKEASVARISSSATLLLKGGVNFPDAIALLAQLEANPVAADDLWQWRNNISSGLKKFSEIAARNRLFPPLFVWMVTNSGEDLPAGFQRAAEMYQSRAIHRAEIALYSLLPISILFLGAIVLSQAILLAEVFAMFMG